MGKILKVIIMDSLKKIYPERFNESGQMDYKWFEKDIRDNYDVFIRKDVMSVTHQFKSREEFEAYIERFASDNITGELN